MAAFPTIDRSRGYTPLGAHEDMARLAAAFQRGVATLVGGTVSVTGVTLTASSRIQLTRNTPGGAVGDLSAPAASRNTGTSTFVINSASGTDTSTVDWEVVG